MRPNDTWAFPHEYVDQEGMTLRDWFAGQALSGILADSKVRAPIGDCVKTAFIFADAMLEEREKK